VQSLRDPAGLWVRAEDERCNPAIRLNRHSRMTGCENSTGPGSLLRAVNLITLQFFYDFTSENVSGIPCSNNQYLNNQQN